MELKEHLQHDDQVTNAIFDIKTAYHHGDISLFEAINHLSQFGINSRSEIQKALDLTIDKLKLRLKNENLRYNKDTKRYNKFIDGKFILPPTESVPKDISTKTTNTPNNLDINTFLNNLQDEDKKKVSYRLPQSLDSAIKVYSALSNKSATDIIIEALKDHIPNHVFEIIINNKIK